VDTILTHEYILALYGIILWQIEQHFTRNTTFQEKKKEVGISLIWVGMLITFDDEIVSFLNISIELTWYHYVGLGFFIDIIRQRITGEKKEKVGKKVMEPVESKF